MRLSARNQIPATVTAITAGEATANIELNAGGVRLVASITVEAARELGLAAGSQVTAVIKASDVIVAAELSPGETPPVPRRMRARWQNHRRIGRIRPFPGGDPCASRCPRGGPDRKKPRLYLAGPCGQKLRTETYPGHSALRG
jgi:molybdopterin-binding protein